MEENGKPYAGCYVNMSIRLWAQDNQFGKRVNAQLRAVQFVKDGEAFGDKPVDPQKELSRSRTLATRSTEPNAFPALGGEGEKSGRATTASGPCRTTRRRPPPLFTL